MFFEHFFVLGKLCTFVELCTTKRKASYSVHQNTTTGILSRTFLRAISVVFPIYCRARRAKSKK